MVYAWVILYNKWVTSVFKTFIAATCAAALAGGMIYFSSTPDGSSGKVSLEKPTETAANITTETTKLAGEAPEKSVMKRYLGGDEKAPETVSRMPAETLADENSEVNPYEAENSDLEASIETPVEDVELDVVHEATPTPEELEELFDENGEPRVDESDVPAQVNLVKPEEDSAEVMEAQVEVSTEEIVLDADTPEIPSVSVASEEPEVSMPEMAQEMAEANPDVDTEIQTRVDAIFDQAEKIEQDDLRDRAYLSLVDYAAGNFMFDQAEKAALSIRQVELRDTARSRIAMALARQGRSEPAFQLIEEVEINELRDVMRLQVIEAMTGAENRR